MLDSAVHFISTLAYIDTYYGYSDREELEFDLMLGAVVLLLLALHVASYWRLFEKASRPGWAAAIPVYNYVVLCRIVGVNPRWLLFLFVPCLGLAVFAFLDFVIRFRLAPYYGKGGSYGNCMLLFPIIFLPVLAFGKSKYVDLNADVEVETEIDESSPDFPDHLRQPQPPAST